MNDSSSARQDKTRQALRLHGKRLRRDLKSLAEAVWGEEHDAQEHARCLEFLPTFVRAEVNGEPVAKLYPDIKDHLDQCEDCAREYVLLLELALADARGELPSPMPLPEPDLTFLTGSQVPPRTQPVDLKAFVLQLARTLIKRISPQSERSVELVAPLFFEQVQDHPRFYLEAGGLQALVGSGVREPSPALTTLAASYATAKALQEQVTADQLENWFHKGTLSAHLETYALAAAREINLESETASRFAHEFAIQFGTDTALSQLLERQ